MPTVELPVTTYQIRSSKPTQRWGSPAALAVAPGSRVLCRIPFGTIPVNAVMTASTLRVFSDRASAGSRSLRVNNSGAWKSSVTWDTRPASSSTLQTITKASPAKGVAWDADVTAWALARPVNGLMLDSLGTGHWLRGSAGASLKPVLIVDYFVPSEQPGALVPDGGAVSVAAPILTYVGAEDMTAQKIDYSTDGVAVSYTTNWIPAVEGYYAPTGGEPVLTDGGDGIYWRATTDGPSGQSLPSEWAFYSYDSLPTVAITSPGATTPDGSPVMQWTVTGGVQTSWRALFQSDGQTIDEAKWTIDAATRDWTPGKSIAVPDALGLYTLEVRDDVTPRVAAPNAPTTRTVTVAFETTLDGAATAVDTIDCTYDEPVPIISGTRAAGVPDEVALVRDGVIVPLWDDDGNIYTTWAPGALFFSGTDYTLLDYTAEPRTSPTWGVRTRTGGTTVSAAGPTVTKYIATGTVWLVNPVTGERVEVCGADGAAGPVVDQATVEQSIVHVPINGGVLVEPKRRRLLRTTKSGSVAGMVQGEAEGVLTGWAEGDSATRYRLIFGKVNWTVIIGDYDPLDVFYPDDWGPDRVNIALNWWQRLGVI